MMEDQKRWVNAKNELIRSLSALGYSKELGDEIAKNLGSPQAMHRMTAYLDYVKPKKVELVVDEMLAIREEIMVWREKKESERANAAYNELLEDGFGDESSDE